MTIVDLSKNIESHTITIVAEYPATTARVWELWADPRQLERWWGPPTHPATVTDHDLAAGGMVRYFMTAPDGQRFHGGWRILRAEEPHSIELEDFFADEGGGEIADLPTGVIVVSIEDAGAGSARMTIETRYASAEAMQKVLEMGMEEGIRQALGQIDGLLAARAA